MTHNCLDFPHFFRHYKQRHMMLMYLRCNVKGKRSQRITVLLSDEPRISITFCSMGNQLVGLLLAGVKGLCALLHWRCLLLLYLYYNPLSLLRARVADQPKTYFTFLSIILLVPQNFSDTNMDVLGLNYTQRYIESHLPTSCYLWLHQRACILKTSWVTLRWHSFQ